MWIDHFKLKDFGYYYKNMYFFLLLSAHARQYHIALGFCSYMVLGKKYMVIFSVLFVINTGARWRGGGRTEPVPPPEGLFYSYYLQL